MPCEHELRAVNPRVVVDREGNDVEIVGAPPQTKEEPAWCVICGALRSKAPFGLGWRFQHPLSDTETPTLLNMIRKQREKKTETD